jgi:multidrug efflux pump subunit AcrA (membrane-fusion protein)
MNAGFSHHFWILVASMAALALGCRREADSRMNSQDQAARQHDEHVHSEHEHEHAEGSSIELSDAALKNIGYQPYTVVLGDYERTISMPGMVVERPGKSQIRVSAPLSGVVTRSYVMQGEAVAPGSPLFDIRLTHEELVSAQGVFLETAEALDVVAAEIRRLESLTEGVVAGKRVLEQKYERQKLEAKMRAQRQGLLLHGLSEAQVDEILATRRLLKSLKVNAPSHEDCPTCHTDHPFHVQALEVQTGQQVAAGDALCVLADHCELYIEGTAFEVDVQHLRDALENDTPLSADVRVSAKREREVGDLKLLYLSDQVDRQSRALHFYVRLPNEIISDRHDDSRRFVQWRFNPGQRVELRLPVERWSDRLVVPAEAVVKEGAESYVYRQSGERFDRVPVHVEHRDKQSAVIANDGSVFPGEVIAATGTFQIHLALKNKSGGAIDPHAGHQH